jgi:dTDP-6-deoxy-L-talose 4-dehydrogenase (NAD+)
MSGGEQIRDYLHVDQVAKYLVGLALSTQSVGLINVCSKKPISIRRLVEQWVERHDWKIQLNLGYYPYPDYEPMAFWGNSSKLKSMHI